MKIFGITVEMAYFLHNFVLFCSKQAYMFLTEIQYATAASRDKQSVCIL